MKRKGQSGKSGATRGREREVINVIDWRETLRMTLPQSRGPLQVREKMNGSWIVLYPDPGFIPCAPVCHLRHKHEYEQTLIESTYKPTDFDDAMDWASSLADGREIKIVKYERHKAKSAA